MKLYTELINGECIQLLQNIKDESIDAVVTEPPYCYLNTKAKNSDFDKHFDNQAFVNHCKRILKKTGFVVIFGRGENFYRLNTMFLDAGFKYKEDVVWDKALTSSLFLKLGRVHENISIFTKKEGVIRQSKIPFLEGANVQDIKNKQDAKVSLFKISECIRRINEVLNNTKKIHYLQEFLNGNKFYNKEQPNKNLNIIHEKILYKQEQCVNSLQSIVEGKVEKDIINIPTIIKEPKLKNTYHPTEKPVRLMERLIALVTDEGDIVLDPFMGSGTTGVACIKSNRHFVGIELDEKYYDIAYRRIEDEKRECVKNLFDVLDDETIKELEKQRIIEDKKNTPIHSKTTSERLTQNEINELLGKIKENQKLLDVEKQKEVSKSFEEIEKEVDKEYERLILD